MNGLTDLYLGAFLVGTISTVGLFLLGAGHHGHGGHAHAGHAHAGHAHGGHAHGHAHAAHGHAAHAHVENESLFVRLGLHGVLAWLIPILNLTSLLALLMCGGAAGYVSLRLGASRFASELWAGGFGVAGAYLMALVTRLLARAESGVVQAHDPTGTVGRLIAPVGPGRTGELSYTRPDGSRHALPARAEESGAELPRDTEVVVMRVERGVAYVRAAGELFGPSERGESK